MQVVAAKLVTLDQGRPTKKAPIGAFKINEAAQPLNVAAKLATYSWGGDRSKAPIGDLKLTEAAQSLNVGKRSVERAKKVLDNGAPDVREAVERGNLSVHAAAAITGLTECCPNHRRRSERRSPDSR